MCDRPAAPGRAGADGCVYQGVGEHAVYVDPGSRVRGLGSDLLRGLCLESERHGWLTSRGFADNRASSGRLQGRRVEQVALKSRRGMLDGQWKGSVRRNAFSAPQRFESLIDVGRYIAMPESMSVREAASAIGISVDTLRRWDRAGKVQSYRTGGNHRRIPVSEVVRLARRPLRHRAGAGFSARNRLHGVVRSVEIDGVMALVEIEAGPFLVSAAVTRAAVEELGLVPRLEAAAVVKATDVMIERSNG